MAVLQAPDSAFSKESIKWEAQASAMGPGLRPYVKRDYPMMLHLAGPPKGGLGAPEIIETIEVGSEREARSHESRGFRPTPLDALAHYDAQLTEFATLAAERNSEVRRAGEKAKGEVERAEAAAGAQHLPTIPETPIRHRIAKEKE